MGAPHFLSPQELESWIRIHFDSVKRFYLNSLNPVIELLRSFKSGLFGNLLKSLLAIRGSLLRAQLRELLKRIGFVKALYTPLRIIPNSLHPIDAAA